MIGSLRTLGRLALSDFHLLGEELRTLQLLFGVIPWRGPETRRTGDLAAFDARY